MDINIKIEDQSLQKTLASLVDRGEDLSPAMQAIAGALGRGIERTFRDQAAPDGLFEIERKDIEGAYDKQGQKIAYIEKEAQATTS